MVVLVTLKNEGDPINTKALEWSQHYISFLKCSRGANSITGNGILEIFKIIQAFIVVLICNYEEDLFKIKSTIVVTTVLPL